MFICMFVVYLLLFLCTWFSIVVCYCYRAVCVQLAQVNCVNEGDMVGWVPIQTEMVRMIKMMMGANPN